MQWPDPRILELLSIELPIIQAPMAGPNTSALAIAVSQAGGLGSLGSWLVWGGMPWGLGLIVLGVLLWVAPSLRPTAETTRWAPPAGSWPTPGDATVTRPTTTVAPPFEGRPGVTVTAAGTTLVPPPQAACRLHNTLE